ncbi:MAG: hypothetical protein Q7S23_05545 [bacterium]|nr:hypothetical protein [bacterium]
MNNERWFSRLREQARLAAEHQAKASEFRMFGHVIGCIDGRCGTPVYGSLPYKHSRILGAYVDRRNARAIMRRLRHDAQRAEARGLRQLVVCETHTDCAYRATLGVSELDVWENFCSWCQTVPNTKLVWISRDVASGAVRIHAANGIVDAARCRELSPHGLSAAQTSELLQRAGICGHDLVHDLSRCLQGNIAYLGQPYRCSQHREEGIVVGSGLAGDPSYFMVSDRVQWLKPALGVAVNLLLQRSSRPIPVAVVIQRHPHRSDKDDAYAINLHALKGAVARALQQLSCQETFPLMTAYAVKGRGDLVPCNT